MLGVGTSVESLAWGLGRGTLNRGFRVHDVGPKVLAASLSREFRERSLNHPHMAIPSSPPRSIFQRSLDPKPWFRI